MRALLLVVAIAAVGFFFYRRSHPADPEAEATTSPDKTPGANAKNRVDNLSGSVDVDP